MAEPAKLLLGDNKHFERFCQKHKRLRVSGKVDLSMTAPNDEFLTESNRQHPRLRSRALPTLRRINARHLRQVADELRAETINAVAVTGGHLGASLGVIELTVALHYIFDTPNDKLDLGRRPSSLSSQDSDWPQGSNKNIADRRWLYQVLPSVPKANTTASAPPTPRHRYRQVWAWLWHATLPASNIT